MRRVRCYECGRSYDFDQDDFCPNCGAFNQPPQTARVAADGSVIQIPVRRDGIDERNHDGSFVHREFHAEERARRGTPLEQRRKPTAQERRRKEWNDARTHRFGRAKAVAFVILLLIALQILRAIVRALLFW